jgi:CHAD domain-containing protein
MAKAREVPGLHAQLPYREAAAATVRVRAQELEDAREGVLDTGDIERVHTMRVATRRLRAVLEIYRPCFDREAYAPVLRDVKALADALGARRDPDVQLQALQAFAKAMPSGELAGIDLLADEVREEQAQGNELLSVALAEAERSDLHGRLLALLGEPA